MHHYSASKYYKMNVTFLLLFLGVSYYNYKNFDAVFWNQRFAKLYIGLIASGIIGTYLFANKHIQALYLLKGQKEIGIVTYSNFGMSYNRVRKVPIDQLKGNRLFWTESMNLYYLEYNFRGRMTNLVKQRSFFYRPEFITNKELWNEIKQGKEVLTLQDIQSAEELDMLRKMKKRKSTLSKYR